MTTHVLTPTARAGAVSSALRRAAAVIRRIIGVPDYEGYLAHQRAHHPQEEPMGEREFHRERLAARYSRPGSRCC
ncbi:MAG: YbdD/YjiX family protein [Gemmatimonadota bacterium]|nr:YbdD/YjiX family protein [Gemmatimonadota bacterium]